MKTLRKWSYFFFLPLFLLLHSCSIEPVPTEIFTIDLGKSPLHTSQTEYGVVFTNDGCGSREALSDNLIYNSHFSLGAFVPPLCVYNPEESTLTTPNKFTIPYPQQGSCDGWKAVRGKAFLMAEKMEYDWTKGTPKKQRQNYYMLLANSSQDSIPGIRVYSNTKGAFFSVKKDDIFSISFRAKRENRNDSIAPVLSFYVMSMDSTCVSTIHKNPIESEKFKVYKDSISIHLDADSAFLVVESSGIVGIDDIKLRPLGYVDSQDLGLPKGTYHALRAFSPDFSSFPGGGLADGYYETTYYSWGIDSLYSTDTERPIWTLGENEFSGRFTMPKYLVFSKLIEAKPHYVINSGITSMRAEPRHENILEIPKRVEYINKVTAAISERMGIKHLNFSDDLLTYGMPKIVLGSEMSGTEYTRRYEMIDEEINTDSLGVELIPGGELEVWPPPKFSYVHSTWRVPTFESFLKKLPPEEDSLLFIRQPILLAEVNFEPVQQDRERMWPQLIDRAVALIEVEKRSAYVRGISFSPLYADNSRWNRLPLLHLEGGKAVPSDLYYLMLYSKQFRGDRAYSVAHKNSDSQDVFKVQDVYLSCTTSILSDTCFIKAANTRRHEIVCDVNIKNSDYKYTHAEVVRFKHKNSLSIPHTRHFEEYVIEREETDVSNKKYLPQRLSPFEIVLIKMY